MCEDRLVKIVVFLTNKKILKNNFGYIKNRVIINAITGEILDFDISGNTLESLKETKILKTDDRSKVSEYELCPDCLKKGK